jgi:hypothetical protein
VFAEVKMDECEGVVREGAFVLDLVEVGEGIYV